MLRAAVIGIDGAGKSSTAMRAIELLRGDFGVAKPGRDPFFVRGAERVDCLPRVSGLVERAFKRADASRRRLAIGATRLVFIRWQAWLEPHMIRRFEPDVVLGTRCMVVDPAIYSEIYLPTAAQWSLAARLRAFRRWSGLPLRHLYVFLRTPARVAMERIHGRIARLPGYVDASREHWLHLHEEEATLARLEARFEAALNAARALGDFEVVAIDTQDDDEPGVARRIAEEVAARVRRAGARACA
jgi:thymidylate kinase